MSDELPPIEETEEDWATAREFVGLLGDYMNEDAVRIVTARLAQFRAEACESERTIRRELEERLGKADSLADKCLEDQRECFFCERFHWPESSYFRPHDENCPLVELGYVNRMGERETAPPPPTGEGSG